MVKWIITIALLIWANEASSQVPAYNSSKVSSSNAAVTITADLTAQGFTIPANFIGFVLTSTDIVSTGYFTGTNTSFINLAKMLGPNGVMRIASQDHGTPPAWTQQIANDLASMTSAIGPGWTLIAGIDAIPTNTTTAVQQAIYFANAFGASNVTFQFGNEPIITGNFNATTYATMWNSYYAAVTGAVSGASYGSTDDAIFNNLTTIIPTLTPGLAGIAKGTLHYYTGACGQQITASALISKLYADVSPAGNILVLRNSGYLGNKQFFTETSAVCGGGVNGVSNALMIATWFLNETFLFSSQGVSGITPTGVYQPYGTLFGMSFVGVNLMSQAWYNPFVVQNDLSFAPGMIFYGMYLFSKIQGQVTTKLNTSGNAWVASIATIGANGNANIIAVNNEVSRTTTVKPEQSSVWSTAKVLILQGSDGNGCSAKSVTLGGAAIGKGGDWTGSPITINRGDSFQLPPCAAALVQIQP